MIGKVIVQGPGIQGTISDYNYTDMRDVLVDSLCAIAVFLMSCRGYDRTDEITGDLAGVFAVGAAFFPITSDSLPTDREELAGALQVLFAGSHFLTLAFFSLVLFRKTDQPKPTRKKLQRNIVYTECGYSILGCIVLIGVVSLTSSTSPIRSFDPVFWLKSIAVVSFGISWLTKGEAILKDNEA